MKNSNQQEWLKSGIAPSLIKLNLKMLTTDEIAEWFFQYLPHSARRNDGRIRDGYLRAYSNPLQGGWGIEGYDLTDLLAEPELRCFKADNPRISKDGKAIRYDSPKNSKHHPILPRVSYEIASIICRQSGVNFLAMTEKYAPLELVTGVDDEAECRWFWMMILDNPQISITLTEGGKKCLALLSQGRCAVALTSITTWRLEKGSNKVHHWLALLAHQRRCFIAFDQDEKLSTQKAVNTQGFKLGNGLMNAGAIRVKRITWTGTAKGIDDFIYNTKTRYGDRYLHKQLRSCYLTARDYRTFISSGKLPGNIRIVNKRYLDLSDVKDMTEYLILVVKSPKGTAKTSLLSYLTDEDRAVGIPTINLSCLERLARELGIRIGIPYRTEKNTVSLRNALGYSLCFDSFTPDNLVPFIPEQWVDAALALDEFTQGLRHVAWGQTELRHYRKVVLATLGQKLADCWANNRPIRLLDADADLETMELIYDLIQVYLDEPITREQLEAKTLTLINKYQPKKGDCYFYNEPSPKQILFHLTKMMKNRENLLILSSSQKSRSADGTINLEKKAQKYYKKSEILRIDSKTTADPDHPAFGITGEILAQLLKQGIYKIIIASPTICTGISIDGVNGYFSGVFSFQSGNITANAVRQQLVRLRDFECPRYVWTPKVGKNFVGCKSTNPIELLTNQKGQAKLSFGFLGFKEAEKVIESNICALTKYWAKVGAKQNQENYHYREVVRAGLEEEGWNIIEVTPNDNDDLKAVWEERKEIKKSSIKEDNLGTVNAKDLTLVEAAKLESKANLREVETKQLEKHQLKQRYHVEEVTEELVEADAKKLHPSLRLKFWLTMGRDYVEKSDRAFLKKMQEQNHGSFFVPDVNKVLKIDKVRLLEFCNIKQFLEPGKEWCNKSLELIKLSKTVFGDLARFNQILGCGIAINDSPITVVEKILKRINQRLPYLRNERDGDKRLRIYGSAKSKLDALSDKEATLFGRWLNQCKAKFDAPDVA